jgi:hypothetical protein
MHLWNYFFPESTCNCEYFIGQRHIDIMLSYLIKNDLLSKKLQKIVMLIFVPGPGLYQLRPKCALSIFDFTAGEKLGSVNGQIREKDTLGRGDRFRDGMGACAMHATCYIYVKCCTLAQVHEFAWGVLEHVPCGKGGMCDARCMLHLR